MAFKNIKTASQLRKEKDDREKEEKEQKEARELTNPKALAGLVQKVSDLEKRIQVLENRK